MSEEFLRVARKEVNEDITEIGNLLKNCHDDSDILKKASDIEKRIHKLKGLTPMMGQEQIGEITVLLDKLLKIAMSGKTVPGIYGTIKDSHLFMQDAMNNVTTNFSSLKSQIEKNHNSFLK
jgi:chemotaxis protein histidine kinase CheA